MDYLINKLLKILDKKFPEEKSIKIAENIYFILIFLIVLAIGYICGNVVAVIIFSLIFNLIRIFSGGYHATSLDNCVILTLFLFGIYIFCSNFIFQYNYFYIFIILSLYCLKHIIQFIPICETDFINWDDNKHKKYCSILLIILIFAAILFNLFDIYNISNYILLSIIFTDLTLVKNPFNEG